MVNDGSAVDLLGSSLHVWPDFHGNRSPLADPTLKGMVREHDSKPQLIRLHIICFKIAYRYNLEKWSGLLDPLTFKYIKYMVDLSYFLVLISNINNDNNNNHNRSGT